MRYCVTILGAGLFLAAVLDQKIFDTQYFEDHRRRIDITRSTHLGRWQLDESYNISRQCQY